MLPWKEPTVDGTAPEHAPNGGADSPQPATPEAKPYIAASKDLKPIDKKWANALLETDANKMSQLVNAFSRPDADVETKEVALELLEGLVQMMDNASDLHHPTVNGLAPLIQVLNDNNASVRLRAAYVLGTALQHNPKVRDQVVSLDGCKALTLALTKEIDLATLSSPAPSASSPSSSSPSSSSPFPSVPVSSSASQETATHWETIGKLVYAVSALIQHNPPAQRQFRELGLFSLLCRILLSAPTPPSSGFNPSDLRSSRGGEVFHDAEEDSEEEKIEPGVVYLKDMSDEIDKAIRRRRKITARAKEAQASSSSSLSDPSLFVLRACEQWLRVARKIDHLLSQLMVENPALRIAYARDGNAEVVRALVRLLSLACSHSQQGNPYADHDLREKVIHSLYLLVDAQNPSVHRSGAPSSAPPTSVQTFVVSSLQSAGAKDVLQVCAKELEAEGEDVKEVLEQAQKVLTFLA